MCPIVTYVSYESALSPARKLLHLPVHGRASFDEPAEYHGATLTQSDTSPLRALVAEDDDELRAFLAGVLRHSGYEVTEISDGAELRAFLAHAARTADGNLPPWADLIVSDIAMPGRTALETLQELKQVADLIPVVLITAFGDRKTQLKALELGAAAVFDKPFNVEEFRTFLTRTAAHCAEGFRAPGSGPDIA
jgi:two-component system response regulator (stage 0 sporulation protein F)